jgi:ADP-heptose:LPS heptosyltransferase
LQEASKRGHEVHAIDLKAEVLGVAPLADRTVDYFTTEAEEAWALAAYPFQYAGALPRKRIGIHLSASSPIRDYHPKQMTQVAQMLYEDGYEVFLLGTAKDSGGEDNFVPEKYRDRMINLVADKLSFRQSAAVLSTCDALVGPDSSMVHVAGALGIPTVGLFAVVPRDLRTSQYPKTRVITGHCRISPCLHHPRHALDHWPKDGPCVKAGFCTALSEINPERVVREVEKALEASP